MAKRLKEVIVCRTHKVLLKKHHDCFRGKEVVDYLANQGVVSTEAEALAMGAQMLQEHMFVRVVTVALTAAERGLFVKSGLYRWYDERERPPSPRK